MWGRMLFGIWWVYMGCRFLRHIGECVPGGVSRQETNTKTIMALYSKKTHVNGIFQGDTTAPNMA